MTAINDSNRELLMVVVFDQARSKMVDVESKNVLILCFECNVISDWLARALFFLLEDYSL